MSEDASAWSDGENDNTAMLPSKASWASKDDKDKKTTEPTVQRKSRNNSISVDYPPIEASAKIGAAVRPITPSRDKKDSSNTSSRNRKDSGSVSNDTKTAQSLPSNKQPAKLQTPGKIGFNLRIVNVIYTYIILDMLYEKCNKI